MTGFDGDGSYQRLIVNVYGIKGMSLTQFYNEYNNMVRLDENVIALLLGLVRSGRFNYRDNSIYGRNSYNSIWGNSVYGREKMRSIKLVFYGSFLGASHPEEKGYGNSVRCVAKKQTLY